MDAPGPPPKLHAPPLGCIEPHAGLLTQPPEDHLLYKIMTVENLLRSIDGAYLHFNRVDSYGDGPGADPHDGAQLPKDKPGNAAIGFEKTPEFTAANYYDRSRSRTYACCFGLENADYLWNNYGSGGAHGKIGLEFGFGRLRARLNAFMASEGVHVLQGDIICHQVFDIDYGIVKYVDWDSHQANTEWLPWLASINLAVGDIHSYRSRASSSVHRGAVCRVSGRLRVLVASSENPTAGEAPGAACRRYPLPCYPPKSGV